MPIESRTLDGLPEEIRAILREYIHDVTDLFGATLEGIVLYGSAVREDFLPGRSNVNVLLLVKEHSGEHLQKYAKVHRRWSKEQIVVPLFLTQSELQSSTAAFPLECLEMQESHRLLGGRDPFVGLHVDLKNLAIQVEQELRRNLIHVRQRYVEGGAVSEAVTILLPLAVTSLLPALRGLQRLQSRPVLQSAKALLEDLATFLGLDLSGLRDAIDLKRGLMTPGAAEVPRLFQRYVAGVEALVRKFDELKKRGLI